MKTVFLQAVLLNVAIVNSFNHFRPCLLVELERHLVVVVVVVSVCVCKSTNQGVSDVPQ